LSKKKIAFVNFASPDALIDHQKHMENLSALGIDTWLLTSVFPVIHYDTRKVKYFSFKTKIPFVKDFLIGLDVLRFCKRESITQLIYLYKSGASAFAIPFLIDSYFTNNKYDLIYDLRSGSIFSKWMNYMFVIESKFYNKVIIISEELKLKLFSSRKNCFVVGLGAPLLGDSQVRGDILRDELGISKNDIVFIYCGTLTGRNLDTLFKKIKFTQNFHLILIGSGDLNVLDNIKMYFSKINLEDSLHFLGPLDHALAMEYLQMADVGMNLIPLSDYYECQPSTKLLEYMTLNLVVCTTKHELSINLLNKHHYPYFIYDASIDKEQLNVLCQLAKQKEVKLDSWSDITTNLIEVFNVKI